MMQCERNQYFTKNNQSLISLYIILKLNTHSYHDSGKQVEIVQKFDQITTVVVQFKKKSSCSIITEVKWCELRGAC